MYVRALQGFHHYGTVRRGETIEVAPDIAAQLLANGLVVEMEERPVAPVAPVVPVASEIPVVKEDPKPGVGPFEPSPGGGRSTPATQDGGSVTKGSLDSRA
jgi:hypothetical protein